MNLNGNEEDNHKAKEEKGMDKYGNATCLQIAELYYLAFAWQLEQDSRWKNNKQNQTYHDWSPICHLIILLQFLNLLKN